jgi:hypothetical protein
MAFSEPYRSEQSFAYLNFLQSINFETTTKAINQKSIGKTLNDKILFNDPDLNINISYIQRTDFLNEFLFGFFYSSFQEDKSIFYNYIKDSFNKNAFILFKDLNNQSQNDLLSDIIASGYSTDLIGIYFEKIFLNSYSFSYSYGSLPIANASFSAEKLKISKLQKEILDTQAYILSDTNRYALNQLIAEDLQIQTNENLGRNIIYLLDKISLENQVSNLEAPISNIDNFLSGNVETFNLSIDLARNRFLFFEKGNETFSREFLLPCVGSIEFSGKTASFTEKSLQDFIKSNNKFSLKLKIGKENFNSAVDDYTEISISNIALENFSYQISINGILNYSIKCSFEINQDNGFNLNVISQKETNLSNNRFILRTSDGQFLRSGNLIFTAFGS